MHKSAKFKIRHFILLANIGWCSYCYGKDFWHTIVEAKKQIEDESESDETSTIEHNKPSSAFNDLVCGQTPLTSIITQMKQTEIVRLLEFQVEWAELVSIKLEEQGLWIYALMASLEKPPHPDVTRYVWHIFNLMY